MKRDEPDSYYGIQTVMIHSLRSTSPIGKIRRCKAEIAKVERMICGLLKRDGHAADIGDLEDLQDWYCQIIDDIIESL